MQPDDWARLKTLFTAALEHAGADREAFLERACREHADLAAELRALVAAHGAQTAGLLDQPMIALAPDDGELDEPDAEPTAVLAAGEVLDGTYEVEAALGRGGMGEVYRVRHKGLLRTFAAKLIRGGVAADAQFGERFTREAEALGRLKHPHIVDVTDFGVDRDRGAPYLVMEYLEGETLQQRLRSGPLAIEDALPVFDAIAAALDYAHEQGVLHLDLKPGNIVLVGQPDGSARPTILDFGLAQFLPRDRTEATVSSAVPPIGTPAYMAPEILAGSRATPAADLYAFGVLMYEVVVGRGPFVGSTTQIFEQTRHGEPPVPSGLNPAVPAAVDGAFVAALAKGPSARPASAGAAVAAVRAAFLTARQRQWRRVEMPRRLGTAAAVAVVVALLPSLWDWAPLRDLEARTVDTRFRQAARRPPAAGILLLLLDDASLAVDSTPLATRADRFGVDLEKIFRAGARAVAVDFLLPEAWSRSAAFSQLVVRHADRLTLAAFSTASGEVIGPECVSGATAVVLGPQRATGLFGFVNLDQDRDGVSRRARVSYRDREGVWRPSFAGRAAATTRLDPTLQASAATQTWFWIDHTIDADGFERVSWRDLEATLRARPSTFRDRLVIVGADFAGSGDRVRVPNAPDIPGAVLHGVVAETILAGFPVVARGESGAAQAMGIAWLLFSTGVLLVAGARQLAGIAVAFAAVYVAGAFFAFREAKMLVPIVGPVVATGVGTLAALGIHWWRPAFPRR